MSDNCSYCGGGYQVRWVDVGGDPLCVNCADDTGLEKQLANQLHKLLPGYYWGAYLEAAETLLGTFAEVWGGAYQQGVSDKREADNLQIDVGVGIYAQPDRANPFMKWAEKAVKDESVMGVANDTE